MLQGSSNRCRVKVQTVFEVYPPCLWWDLVYTSNMYLLHASSWKFFILADYRMEVKSEMEDLFNAKTVTDGHVKPAGSLVSSLTFFIF